MSGGMSQPGRQAHGADDAGSIPAGVLADPVPQLVAAGHIRGRRYQWLALPPQVGDLGMAAGLGVMALACPECGSIDTDPDVCLTCGAWQ